MPKNIDISQDPTKILGQLIKANSLMLSPYQKGVKKKLEEAGYANAGEALKQNVPQEHIAKQAKLDSTQILSSLLEQSQSQPNLEQNQPQPNKSSGYTTKPASSPFGFGGMKMDEQGNIEEQKSGILASLLSTIFAGEPNAGARMDMMKMKRINEFRESTNPETKGVYGVDKRGGLSLLGEVPKGADVRSIESSAIESLPPEERNNARALARRLYGVRGIKEGIEDIVTARQAGMSYDNIEDQIRFSAQSPTFSGAMRNAAQQLSINQSESTRNVNFDALDDYLQQGNVGGAKDYLKEMARSRAGVDQQNQILGKERTVEFLNEIKDNLDILKKNKINTNIFRGTEQQILNKVGMVGNPELVKVATDTALALFEYRRAMTGVQFGMKEHTEYEKVFPSIKRESGFNIALLESLTSKFSGDMERFYKQKMGDRNYNEIFGKKVDLMSGQTTQSEESNPEYQKYLQLIGGQ